MAAPNTQRPIDLAANYNAEIISICTVFAVLCLLAVVARLASRRLTGGKFAADDFLLVGSWTIALGESVLFIVSTKLGKGGWHAAALTPANIVAIRKLLLQTTSLALAKLSFLILLHCIFITRRFRLAVYILTGIVCCWWVAIFFGGAFVCYPAQHIWDPKSEDTCGNQNVMDIISPIPWVLIDFAILVSPLPVIKQLQLTKGRRWRLYASFLMGGFTCVVSVARYRTLFLPLKDFSWDLVPIADWNIIEVQVTVMCAALVASKPVLTRLIPE